MLGTLGINGKLFLAQLVNFAIVLFVLWRWVFGPVAGALEKRRQRVETSLKEAKKIEQRLQSFEQEHGERLKRSRVEAEEIVQKAVETADRTKAEIAESAKSEAERILRDARETIQAEKDGAIKAVRREVAELSVAGAEKVMRVKLTDEEDREIINSLFGEIK